jgi:hypothetical protein
MCYCHWKCYRKALYQALVTRSDSSALESQVTTFHQQKFTSAYYTKKYPFTSQTDFGFNQ